MKTTKNNNIWHFIYKEYWTIQNYKNHQHLNHCTILICVQLKQKIVVKYSRQETQPHPKWKNKTKKQQQQQNLWNMTTNTHTTTRASTLKTHVQHWKKNNNVPITSIKYIVTQSILCMIFLIIYQPHNTSTMLDKNLKQNAICSLCFWHTCGLEPRSRSSNLVCICTPQARWQSCTA